MYECMWKYTCCECWGHNIDFTRAFIVVLVRHLSSTTDVCLWFASHGVVTVCCIQQTNEIRYYIGPLNRM